MAYIMEEFRQIDRSKYHVAQCLFTARRVFKSNGKLAFPKYHLLVVDRSAEADAVVRCLGLFFLQGPTGRWGVRVCFHGWLLWKRLSGA